MTAEPQAAPPRTSSPDEVGWWQTAALGASIVIAAVVGVWSYALPQEFFDHFPSVLGEWVSQDGPYNEHLVRDHGAMYLALGAASVAGVVWRTRVGFRLLGVAWTVFGILHFAYHVTHLGHMSTSDAVAQTVVLGVAVVLGVLLLIPPRPHVSSVRQSAGRTS
ncbi:hypothetical protein [Isoptericola aurantiacus]|uniref:hypothetical protein n=1 Tax=Isoptericola aurantiacus TaxID=3377839 RepID=UPI00383A2045